MHFLIKILKDKGELSQEEAREIYRKNNKDARGIGGLSKTNLIIWDEKNKKWKPSNL